MVQMSLLLLSDWNLLKGLTLALLMSSPMCLALIRSCFYNLHISRLKFGGVVIELLDTVYYLWYCAAFHSSSGSCFASV